MLELAGDFDAFLCGDDAITRAVIDKSLPRLKVISKYGIGLDKVDVEHATRKGIPVTFCPGVNHTTVAEHVFALLLALVRYLVTSVQHTRSGQWTRLTGNEILGKTIGIVGLGRIGREVATRALAFGMNVMGYDIYWDSEFAESKGIHQCGTLEEIFSRSDIISLHTNLSPETRHMINADSLQEMKDQVLIINCARGELVDPDAMVNALEDGKVGGYGTDVLEVEPPPPDHPHSPAHRSPAPSTRPRPRSAESGN